MSEQVSLPHPAGAGEPGGPPAESPYPGHPPTAGQPWSPSSPPHFAGSPWLPPSSPHPDAARLGRILLAGAAALALAVGSAIGGGVVALALHDSPSPGPTYNAAPIIDSADLPAIAESVQDSVVSITVGGGEGSGVVLTEDGYILTNNHVVAGSGGRLRVAFANGETAAARVVGTDPRIDLAVIKAEGVSDLSPARFGDSDAMRVGDTVLALGSPLGLEGSVTAGIISAKNRTIRTGGENPLLGATTISGLLQTDAPINPGNSGGALVNTRGEVIGINTAIATAGQSSGNIGLGFAIPSNKAKAVADALMKGEKVSHPTLGVSVTDADGGGALVAAVVAGSPADQAGLRQGDVITQFGDRAINDSDALVAAVQAGKVGDRVEVTYKRDGVERKATVTLAEAS